MAKLRAEYRSKKEYTNLTFRFTFQKGGKPQRLDAKSNIYVEKEYWFKKHNSNSRDPNLRSRQTEINNKIQNAENYILGQYDKTPQNSINKEWYRKAIEDYCFPKEKQVYKENVSFWIQHKIDNAHLIPNSKGGMGLSIDRVSKLKTLKNHFISAFDDKIKIKEFDKIEFENFIQWSKDDKGFSDGYAMKMAVDLKSIINYALGKGIRVSDDFNSIVLKEIKSLDFDMDVIFLSLDEIEKIKKVNLISDELINARKWLLTLCWTGQRGGIFTEKLNPKLFKKDKKGYYIEYTQKKGNKPVTVPVLPYLEQLFLNNDLPKKMTTQRLNKLFPEIGKIAGIDEVTLGKLQEVVEIDNKRVRRTIKKDRPKFEYIKTHTGRRSFASNHYGKMPNEIIMAVTGHSKLNTFLTYVNKSSNIHIETFREFYKSEKEVDTKSPLRILNTAN